MWKSFREKFRDIFGRDTLTPSPISESSSLEKVADQFPNFYQFIEERYHIKISANERGISLKSFVEKFSLPPAQVLFMEAQMNDRLSRIQHLAAREAKKLLTDRPEAKLLDVREDWELKLCRLPGSQPFSPALLDELLTKTEKEHPIIVYCHFGVRSLDAALYLNAQGFSQVFVIQGGIDAWSQEVDPSLERYESAYC